MPRRGRRKPQALGLIKYVVAQKTRTTAKVPASCRPGAETTRIISVTLWRTDGILQFTYDLAEKTRRNLPSHGHGRFFECRAAPLLPLSHCPALSAQHLSIGPARREHEAHAPEGPEVITLAYAALKLTSLPIFPPCPAGPQASQAHAH